MANWRHLKILAKGVENWNRWREENPKIKPDLRCADLRKRNLNYANLTDTDFTEANLFRADLFLREPHSVDL